MTREKPVLKRVDIKKGCIVLLSNNNAIKIIIFRPFPLTDFKKMLIQYREEGYTMVDYSSMVDFIATSAAMASFKINDCNITKKS